MNLGLPRRLALTTALVLGTVSAYSQEENTPIPATDSETLEERVSPFHGMDMRLLEFMYKKQYYPQHSYLYFFPDSRMKLFTLFQRPPSVRVIYHPPTAEEQATYFEDFLSLLTITGENGKSLFDFMTLKTLAEQDIPVEYVKRVAMSLDAEGKQICNDDNTASSILLAHGYGIPADFILASQRLSVQKECGVVLDGATTYHSIPVEFLETISTVVDAFDNPVLRMSDAMQLHAAGIPSGYIVPVATLITNEDYVMEYTRKITRYYQLGLTPEQLEIFEDTEKPNAVITYPTKDESNGKRAFETKESLALYQQYVEEYDVWVRVTAREEELYNALEASSSWKFGALAGHGDGVSFVLGEPPAGETDPAVLEKYRLDVNDTEFAESLAHFLPDATLFLHTCFGGRGTEHEVNVANFTHELAPWTNVLASTLIFATAGMKVQSVYPFQATIGGWKDINTPTPLLEATYYIPSETGETAQVYVK